MITHIRTKGFKGQDINEDLHNKTLFIGPNGCGKSTRSHAIAFVLMGYIPWAVKVKKKPADILPVYSEGDTLTAAITVGGIEFERHLSKSSKGTVTQRLRVDKQKYSATEFAVEIDRAGAPKIFDVSAFMEKSDQKKIELIFNLFPPKGDVKKLTIQIDKKKEELKKLNKQVGTADGVIQRLTTSKSKIALPAGSLAETQAEIETLTAQVKKAQEDLKTAEIEAVKATTEEETREKVQTEQEVGHAHVGGVGPGMPSSRRPLPEKPSAQELQKKMESQSGSQEMNRINGFVSGAPGPFDGPDPAESIQLIIDTLESAGCAACAAKLVAKSELVKFTRRAAA
jgi:predicted ATP-binding protein involved in virulence